MYKSNKNVLNRRNLKGYSFEEISVLFPYLHCTFSPFGDLAFLLFKIQLPMKFLCTIALVTVEKFVQSLLKCQIQPKYEIASTE